MCFLCTCFVYSSASPTTVPLKPISRMLLTNVLPSLVSGFVGGGGNATALVSYLVANFNSSSDMAAAIYSVTPDWGVITVILSCVTLVTVWLQSASACRTGPFNRVQAGDDVQDSAVADSVGATTTLTDVCEVLGDIEEGDDMIQRMYGMTGNVAVVNWVPTQLRGNILTSLSIANVFNLPAITRLFQSYRYARFDLVFTVNFTGNPSACGTLVGFVRPSKPNLPVQTTLGSNIITSPIDLPWSLPHILMQANTNGVYKFVVPYTHYREYLSYNTYKTIPSWGSFNVMVMHELYPPTGTTAQISLDVLCSITNIHIMEAAPYIAQAGEIYYPPRDHRAGNRDPYATRAAYEAYLWAAAEPANIRGDAMWRHPPTKNVVRKGKPSKATQDVSAKVKSESTVKTRPWYSRMLDHMEKLLPNGPAGILSITRDIFAFDHPSQNSNGPVQTVATYQKLNNVCGFLNTDKLALDPSVMTQMDATTMSMLSVPGDEMAMSSFAGRWSYISTATMTNSTVDGSLLGVWPIMPYFGGTPNVNTPTGPSVVATFAKYWRGTMKFRFIAATNQMRTCRILITTQYGLSFSQIPTSYSTGNVDPLGSNSVLWDVSNADGVCEIDVPFRSENGYLRVDPANPNSLTQPQFTECAAGVISAYLFAPVQNNNTVASTIEFTLLSTWGEDMEFFEYVPTIRNYTQGDNQTIGVMTSAQTFINHMSKITSLRELLMSPSYYTTVDLRAPYTTIAASNAIVPTFIPITPMMLFNNPVWGYCLNAFAGCAGSLRIALRISTAQTNASTASTFPETEPVMIRYYDSLNTDSTSAPTAYTEQFGQMVCKQDPYANTFTSQRVLMPMCINTFVTTASNDRFYPNHSVMTAYMGPGCPEKVIEIPNSLGLYRSKPTTVLTTASATSYNWLSDPSIPWISLEPGVIPLANGSSQTDGTPLFVDVSVMAGDDFRFFWFSGTPTSTVQYSGTNNGGTNPCTSNDLMDPFNMVIPN